MSSESRLSEGQTQAPTGSLRAYRSFATEDVQPAATVDTTSMSDVTADSGCANEFKLFELVNFIATCSLICMDSNGLESISSHLKQFELISISIPLNQSELNILDSKGFPSISSI